jgi:fructose-1,6-bisphosphatase/inositol monophosphatase family enzyme
MSIERLDQYGPFLQTTANKATELIRSCFDAPLEVSYKEDGTPVTPIDKVVDYMVLSSVQSTFPDYGYLGEETGGEVSSERFWVCDPLDGTKAYINGIPLATFSLSLVEDKEIVVSIIHDPFTDRSLLAAKGEGAWMNGRQLRVSEQQTLRAADVHMSWGDEGYIHRLSTLRKLGAKVIKMDANIYIGMLIAMGKFDGDIFTGDSLWDIAPQSLAVREAGGIATTLDGNDIPVTKSVNGLILSNGYLHHKLLEIVQESQRGIE